MIIGRKEIKGKKSEEKTSFMLVSGSGYFLLGPTKIYYLQFGEKS